MKEVREIYSRRMVSYKAAGQREARLKSTNKRLHAAAKEPHLTFFVKFHDSRAHALHLKETFDLQKD